MQGETDLGTCHHNAQKTTSGADMAAYLSKYQAKPPVQSTLRELDGQVLPGSLVGNKDSEGKLLRELSVVHLGLTSMVMRLLGRAYTGSYSSTSLGVIYLPVSMEGKEWAVMSSEDGGLCAHKKQRYFDRCTDTKWRAEATKAPFEGVVC